MRVLVACEYSGRVRDAFRRHGHDAWSCDLLECEGDPRYHLQQPVEPLLADGWDLMVAHPPCTHLAVSGSRHFHRKQREQADALDFVRLLMDAPIERWAIENPVSVISSAIAPPQQIIQPWEFGHGETKATCLWLKTCHASGQRSWWKVVRPRCTGCRQGLSVGRSAPAPTKASPMPWPTNGEAGPCRHWPAN